MVTLTHKTPPRIDTPNYADVADGTMLHRYMGSGFMQQFLEDARSLNLHGTLNQAWRETDQFGKHAKGLPTLRLPVHKTFYIVSAEASCDELGRPALDPRRVASAGFVIRRGTPTKPQIWEVQSGVPLGWRKTTSPDAEPDEHRRLQSAGLLRRTTKPELYSGEQTYPLRALLVDSPISNGSSRLRKRTLLHGFLPLSGQAPVPLEPPSNLDDSPDTVSGRLAEHEWPFGAWDGTLSDEDDDPSTDAFVWTQTDGLQITAGRPARAFAQLLRTLIVRYHIYDADQPGNTRLRQLLSRLDLRTGLTQPVVGVVGDLSLGGSVVSQNLLNYINSHSNHLIDWIAITDKEVRENPDAQISKLPQLNNEGLYISEAQAADLREALIQRGDSAERDLSNSLPLPRFQQGETDKYYVRSFLRYIDECNCEKLVWGPDSKPFRVVSPMDPEAAPPTVIQMPELDDVKRGLAKGVTFLTPQSLMNALDKVNPDMEFGEKQANPLTVCMSYSLSFSIPIITICAMILLMIVINLLNFFLRWLPWAFVRLSMKCK